MNIILLEDNATISQNVIEVLLTEGYSIQWLVGVQHFDGNEFIGITDDGSEISLTLPCYDVAIMDGTLLGSYQGWELIPTLVAHKIICIAHSGDSTSNAKMLRSGATGVANKSSHRDLAALIRQIEEQTQETPT